MGALLCLFISTLSVAAGGRSLPSGEDHPAVVEKIFSSPRGEVQFLVRQDGHLAFLRSEKGNLLGLREVRGPAQCDEWFISKKSGALPSGCNFVFHNETDGQLFSVLSSEMEEADLFQAVRGTMRGAFVAL